MEEHNPLTKEVAEGEELPAANSRCSKINVKLLPYKSFYFLFFSAVGSLFPYLAVFYKQIWLSALQTGILIGVRPVLQLLSSATWGIVADKYDKTKYIFLISLVGWLCANFSLSLVEHKADVGPCKDNGSLSVFDNALRIAIFRNETFNKAEIKKMLESIDSHKAKRERREINGNSSQVNSKIKSYYKNGLTERKIDEQSSIGHSPWSFHALLNLETQTETEVGQNNRETFIILLLITVVGTLVAAPAIPFADTATLQALGDQKDFYGKQRQWGAMGWGISSFVVGSVVSTIQDISKCNVPNHVNYQPCFYAFAVLMVLAFIPALFIQFEDRNLPTIHVTRRLRTLMNFNSIIFLLTIQQSGNSWGLLQTFLLWHLQDLGGTQFLFTIITAVQCLSEIVSYHIAGYAITKFGHYRMLYIGLLYSSFRFIIYAIIKNPWMVVPVEIFHGLSTTLIWALAVSFIGLNNGVATTMQGILSGVHWGLGFGGGAIFGGLLVNAIGSKYTFLACGIFSIMNALGFITTQHLRCCAEELEESQTLLTSTAREELELTSIETENTPASKALH